MFIFAVAKFEFGFSRLISTPFFGASHMLGLRLWLWFSAVIFASMTQWKVELSITFCWLCATPSKSEPCSIQNGRPLFYCARTQLLLKLLKRRAASRGLRKAFTAFGHERQRVVCLAPFVLCSFAAPKRRRRRVVDNRSECPQSCAGAQTSTMRRRLPGESI